MSNLAQEYENKVKSKHASATVLERHRKHMVFDLANGQKAIQSSLAPLHILGTEIPIETGWVTDTGAYQYRITEADYISHSRDVFNVGDLMQFDLGGEFVGFDPINLNWLNEDYSQVFISSKTAVNAVINDDVISFQNGYKSGVHFQFRNMPGKFQKLITIDALTDILQDGDPANLPPPSSPPESPERYFAADFNLKMSNGVSAYLDGVLWNPKNNVRVRTVNKIEFKDAQGVVLWDLDLPRAWDSSTGDNKYATGCELEVRKQGGGQNSLFITVRVPWSWIQNAVFPIFVDPTIDVDVSASLDDVYVRNLTTFQSTGNRIRVGDGSSANFSPNDGAFRFAVSGLSGATITLAQFTAELDGNTAGTLHDNNIYFELAESPGQIADATDFYARTLTTNKVAWNPSGATGDALTSGDLTTPAQEIPDAGYDPTYMIVFYKYEGTEATGNDFNDWVAYDGAPTQYPNLYIEYTAGGGGVSVSCNPATLAFSGQSALIVPGTVSVSCQPVTLAFSGQSVTISAGEVSILCQPSVLAFSGQSLSIIVGTTYISCQSANLIFSGQSLSVVAGEIIVSCNPATLVFSAQSATITNVVSIKCQPATLIFSGQSLNVIPGSVSVECNYATLVFSGQSVTITSGATIISCQSVTLAFSGQSLSIVPGQVSVACQNAQLIFSGQSLTVIPGDIVVGCQNANLIFSGLQVSVSSLAGQVISCAVAILVFSGKSSSIVTGAISVLCSFANLIFSCQSLTVVAGNVNVSMSYGTLAFSGQSVTISVGVGGVTVSISYGQLVFSGQSLLVVPGSTSVSINPATLLFTAITAMIIGSVLYPKGDVIINDSLRYIASIDDSLYTEEALDDLSSTEVTIEDS